MSGSRTIKSSNIFGARLVAAAFALGGMGLSGAGLAQDASVSAHGSDAQAVQRVQQALRSDQSLDSRHIDVSIEHGDVVLKGFVQDASSVAVATQVATKAAGERKIVNHVEIKQNYPNAP